MKKSIKSILKKKNILIAILLTVVIATVIILNNSGAITKIGNAIRRNIFALDEENQETNAYYTVGAVNGDYLNCQIAFENARGIEKVIADGVEIDGKGRTKVGIDRVLQESEEKEYRVKLVGVEEEEIHTIYATNKKISINIVNNDTLGDGTTKTVEIDYPTIQNVKNYYSLDDGETWQEYTGSLAILIKDNKTITAKTEYVNTKTIEKTEERENLIISDSLLTATEKAIMHNNKHYRIQVEDEEYNVHAYIENGNTRLSNNNIYGTNVDVAYSNTNANSMVIVKVNGDLTINSRATLTTYSNGYGGPKGLLVYVTGTLLNNGTISMTARGAKAEGQDVYLWKNKDESYEYVPKEGASGGKAYEGKNFKGYNGTDGTNRQTGGGGSGGGYGDEKNVISGAGSSGTSYSGGTGGSGAIYKKYYKFYNNSSHGHWIINDRRGEDGGANGGFGGAGMFGNDYYTLAGIGNGYGGTGGLLIVYGESIINYGKMCSDGTKANNYRSSYEGGAGGGASGGGSVNIFYRKKIAKGVVTALAGETWR